MTPSLSYWQHHLDYVPILDDPHLPLASMLMGISQRLNAVLNLLTTLSDEQVDEKDYGVAVANMAVKFTLKVLRHLGLGDDSPAPPILNLKMAKMVLTNLHSAVQDHLDQWREGLRNEAHMESAENTFEGLIIDSGTFTLSYKGKTCELGNTLSFKLIKRLSEAKGIFLSLRELIQDVWLGKEVSDEAVQKQISILRGKLKAEGIEGIEFESQPQNYRLVLR